MLSLPCRCVVLICGMASMGSAQKSSSVPVDEAVAPAYPPAAVESRIAGTVTVLIHISEGGSVTDARVTEGHPLLRQSSLEAARLWRFRSRAKGRDVTLIFTFRLMPKNTPEAQLGAVFRPPYAVEVRKVPPQKVTHYARMLQQLSARRRPMTR